MQAALLSPSYARRAELVDVVLRERGDTAVFSKRTMTRAEAENFTAEWNFCHRESDFEISIESQQQKQEDLAFA